MSRVGKPTTAAPPEDFAARLEPQMFRTTFGPQTRFTTGVGLLPLMPQIRHN
jgi:hypothetical protein